MIVRANYGLYPYPVVPPQVDQMMSSQAVDLTPDASSGTFWLVTLGGAVGMFLWYLSMPSHKGRR